MAYDKLTLHISHYEEVSRDLPSLFFEGNGGTGIYIHAPWIRMVHPDTQFR
jgi:hypothetical protein